MSLETYGSHSTAYAKTIETNKMRSPPAHNNLTTRNAQMLQTMPMRSVSTSLASANIKALRLFRHICRMVPFILTVHQINHLITPIQAKRRIANRFRDNSTLTCLTTIDMMIQHGYQVSHEATWHFSNTGYLYQFLFSKNLVMRNRGKDHFSDLSAQNFKRGPATGFLKSFYKGSKSHAL